jgi:hypothetical protein
MPSAGPIMRDLIVEFGARAVLASFLREVLAQRKVPDVDTLPDYIRADIGLPPLPPPVRGVDRLR